jgi:hypothetical protein
VLSTSIEQRPVKLIFYVSIHQTHNADCKCALPLN